MYSRNRRLFALAAIALLASMLTGCAESARPQATGEGRIRGVNSIVTAPELNFKIEERFLAGVNFKQVSSFSPFDNLTYNFNFDLSRPGEPEEQRIATQFVDVQADYEYTVVLGGSIANPTTLLWEDPVREWAGTESVVEVFFAHLAPSLGQFDVYFAAPGTTPVAGQSVGSVANGERLPALEFEEAKYQLILTPHNDPATITFKSKRFDTFAQTRITIAIFDPDPTVPGNVAVSLLTASGASSTLPDSRFPSQVRMLHAAFGTPNFDGYVEGDFANVVYPDVGFKEQTPYADVDTTPATFTVTPVGNPGATIHEDEVPVPAGSRNTVAIAGQAGSEIFLRLADNARPLETYPVIRIFNSSVNNDALDIYMVEPGTDLEDVVIPQIPGLIALAQTNFRRAPEGMVELTATLFGEKTPVSTPIVLDLANGDRVDVVVFDTADPAVVELVAFPY